MSKPVLDVVIITPEGARARAKAVLDSGSYYTIVREEIIPKRATVVRYPAPRVLGTAGRGGKIRMVGVIVLDVAIAGKQIHTDAFVSPDLNRDMLIGAGTMQAWDISIVNRNGSTKVVVGRDRRDPDITEVDEV